MQITSNILIQCKNCGRRYSFSPNDLDYDSYSNDAPSDIEVVHNFYGEKTCICGKDLHVKIMASEYPPGGYNYHTCESSGCRIINEPRVEVEFLPEPVLSAIEIILQNPDAVYSMETWEFEDLVADVFRDSGCHAKVTQRTRDGGVDVKISFDMGGIPFSAYIQCKRNLPQNPIGVNVIRELAGVIDRDRIDKGIVVTTSYFSPDAVRETEYYGGRIQLIDYRRLQELMGHF